MFAALTSLPASVLIALALLSLAAFYFALLAAVSPDPDPVIRQGRRWRKKEDSFSKSPIYKLIYPALHYIAGFFARRLDRSDEGRARRVELDRWLMEAGYPGGLTVEEFMALRVFLAATVPFVLGLTSYLVTGSSFWPLMLILALVLGMLPVMAINGTRSQRIFEINRALPYAIDLMALSMKAGLDFNRALAQVVGKRAVSGALAEELKVLTSEIDLGTTRREAFQNLLQRAPSEPLRGVVAAIIQADQMGTPMSDVLAVQSSVMKIKRTQTAEKMAAEAPIKMLVPIMIVLLVVLLTIFGGLVVKGMTGGLLN